MEGFKNTLRRGVVVVDKHKDNYNTANFGTKQAIDLVLS